MGLALGLTLGVIGFVRGAVTPPSVLQGNIEETRKKLEHLEKEQQSGISSDLRWKLALTISLAVATICLWGTLVGSMLPLAFKQLGFDPGYASSPFVATFVDVTGIIIYFSIAKLFLL
jgi:Mg/Co/Ni transporter MgtE